MILFTIDDLYDGNGRKTPKYTKTKKKEKFPLGCPPIHPSTKMEANCFPVSKKKRKQAGPTLGWTGVPI